VRGKNITWLFLVALLLVPMFITNVGVTAPTTKMYVDPIIKDPTKVPGSTFTVTVKVFNVTNLYSWQFKMLFNPNIVQIPSVSSIVKGSFLASAPMRTSPLSLKINNTAGYVLVAETYDIHYYRWKTPPYPTQGATGSGILAWVTFKVMGTGVTLLDLTSTKLNTFVAGNNVPIEHIAQDGLFDNRKENLPPVASFKVTPPTGIVGDTFTFDASTSSDDGWIASYFWDFGDGTNALGQKVDKRWGAGTEGTYVVNLTVTDNDGVSRSAQYTLAVLGWMQAGNHPDLIKTLIWPEHPVFKEAEDGEHETLWAKVGNPTDTPYQVRVDFRIFSKDQGTELGTISTAVETIDAHKKMDIPADFFLGDQRWAVKTGPYNWPYWVKKYWAIGQCFYINETGQWEAGIFPGANQFKVHPVIHDRAIIAMSANYNVTYPANATKSDTVAIDVTVENQGQQIEHNINLTVAVYAGSQYVETLGTEFTTLAIGENQTFTFNWDTTGIAQDNYLILATIDAHPYERLVDTTDNSMFIVVRVVV